MEPSKPPPHRTDRLEYVDTLRGFALFGVLRANLFIFSGFSYMTDGQRAALPTASLDKMVYLLELIFVENKFMGLFAFLFGVSFWLFLDRLRQRGVAGTGLFYRRLLWLFVVRLGMVAPVSIRAGRVVVAFAHIQQDPTIQNCRTGRRLTSTNSAGPGCRAQPKTLTDD
jgi:uncharacterized protein